MSMCLFSSHFSREAKLPFALLMVIEVLLVASPINGSRLLLTRPDCFCLLRQRTPLPLCQFLRPVPDKALMAVCTLWMLSGCLFWLHCRIAGHGCMLHCRWKHTLRHISCSSEKICRSFLRIFQHCRSVRTSTSLIGQCLLLFFELISVLVGLLPVVIAFGEEKQIILSS